jgi:hypothetical protein
VGPRYHGQTHPILLYRCHFLAMDSTVQPLAYAVYASFLGIQYRTVLRVWHRIYLARLCFKHGSSRISVVPLSFRSLCNSRGLFILIMPKKASRTPPLPHVLTPEMCTDRPPEDIILEHDHLARRTADVRCRLADPESSLFREDDQDNSRCML